MTYIFIFKVFIDNDWSRAAVVSVSVSEAVTWSSGDGNGRAVDRGTGDPEYGLRYTSVVDYYLIESRASLAIVGMLAAGICREIEDSGGNSRFEICRVELTTEAARLVA
ncbi:unnamed protein product [Dovyalis caffra]|uniref:Uncharacterized protein n=1 Tax=Dovyalis caffra TaxID=77055 RepID=A0AAV1RYD5_9ROSI|nr:unnamed protein product [Dovyalis caffra]